MADMKRQEAIYYMLIYDVVDNFIERRVVFREEHLKLVYDARDRGVLVMAGALADPVDGAALVFHTDDRSVAERFAENDPYVKAGLVKSWRVRKWNLVVGGETRGV
jgi:uncharacterized protein YciI